MWGLLSKFFTDSKTTRFVLLALFGCFLGLLVVSVIVGGGGLIAMMAVELGASAEGHSAAWVMSSLFIGIATVVVPLIYSGID